MIDVISVVSNTLEDFFIITNYPYNGATDFNREHPLLKPLSREDKKDGIKLTSKIHAIVGIEVAKFGLYPKKIGASRLEIDFWDKSNKVAYEIILGNGDEIWKDVLKAILVGAEKLVVFCRNYPDPYVKGYSEIKKTISHLKSFLKGKLFIQIVKIESNL